MCPMAIQFIQLRKFSGAQVKGLARSSTYDPVWTDAEALRASLYASRLSCEEPGKNGPSIFVAVGGWNRLSPRARRWRRKGGCRKPLMPKAQTWIRYVSIKTERR